jgi:preprotein translocase subunit SecA
VAIVDEADSVLLDEANTALILSGPTEQENPYPDMYRAAWRLATNMSEGEDYLLAQSRVPKLTKHGSLRALAEFDKLGDMTLRRPWSEYVEQALFAHIRLKRDVHYIVADDQVNFVDDHTGRIFTDRTWRSGLHQMLEAKEGVTITPETNPLARISRQQFFQLYEQLCGMTGTARGSERELSQFYGLSVSPIPTRRPCVRRQMPGRYFGTADDKWEAIATEVARTHQTGQPVLIGTRTIESSEALAQHLTDKGTPFQLLNGKQDAEEAEIVARAGHRGAVTVATNVAGRGTDIKLGPGVRELGGLHVIVAEPHDSRRVDRQLMGRAARQGDPGSCQCFASADDELIAVHAPWISKHMRDRSNSSGELPEDLSKSIARVQRKIEQLDYAKRRRAFKHDAWLEDVMAKLADDDSS